MKRLLLVITAALLVVGLFAGPAFASPSQHGKFCITYRNPDHSKQIKVCAELEQSDVDPGTWWARAELADVPGYGEPFAVRTFTDFFSAQANTGPWCQGAAPACNSDGTEHVFLSPPLDGQNSNTTHLPYFDRYCYDEAHVTALVYWNSAQYGTGIPGDHGDILSDISYTNNPDGGWCIT